METVVVLGPLPGWHGDKTNNCCCLPHKLKASGALLFFWILFNLFVLVMLALDLGVFHRRAHTVRFKEALAWSAAWISMAIAFAVIVYFWRGRVSSLEFVTGYVLELSVRV